jgi:hypothetical protein
VKAKPSGARAVSAAKLKAAAAKERVTRLAKDPEARNRVREVATTINELYKVASSPQAMKMYREAGAIVRKTWKR